MGKRFLKGKLVTAPSFFLAAVSAAMLLSAEARAVPLERFEAPLELECEAGSICTKTARSRAVLGGGTGIVLAAGSENGAELRIEQKPEPHLELHGEGEAIRSLMLIWDGDSNPAGLSAAGLGCFDLTASGASAFLLRTFRVQAKCEGPGEDRGCPQLEVESRIYDAADATGQRFSASVLRRPVPHEAAPLIIPFSNFVREGPHGMARTTCVGAISIAFRLEGFKDVSLSVGPIYTNGSDGLTLIPTPTPSPSATPTEEPTATPAAPQPAAASAAPEPSSASSAPTAGPTSPSEPAAPLPSAAKIFATPAALEVFEDEQAEAQRKPAGKGPGIIPETEGDIVYGAVVPEAQ